MSIYYSTYGNGLLYNWYAVEGRDSNNVLHRFAPVGWHVPTDAEFTTLANALGGASVAGGKMKSIRISAPYFQATNVGATNESGFMAFGVGIRASTGAFAYLNQRFYCWSLTGTTEKYTIILQNTNVGLNYGTYVVSYGFSVRLIKDDSNWYPGMIVTDLDGNKYPTVKIGNQVWLQSNWKCTKYADGVPIAFNLSAHVDKFSASEWQNLTYGGYCSYNDVAIVEYTTPNQYKYPTKHFILPKVTDLSSKTTYTYGNGLLYNWYAVNGDSGSGTKTFAPTGWRVPTQTDFTTLSTFLGGDSVAGGKMKSTKTSAPYFASPNTGADDSSGFRAFGAGNRIGAGTFDRIYTRNYYWTITGTTSKYYIELRTDWNQVNIALLSDLKYGLSVRLLKDDSTWYPGMTVTDADGNVYPTVKIGTQVWTQTNWKCTKYTDGTAIPKVTSGWDVLTTGAYCIYGDASTITEYTEAVQNNGLVAAYNMQPVNGVLTDISGNGGNMTVTSCVNSNEGLVFKGLPSYTRCPAFTVADMTTNDFTLCARVKPHSLTATHMCIINKGGTGAVGYSLIISSTGTIGILIQATGGTNQASTFSGFNVVLNKWIDIIVSFDRDDVMKLYVNGSYVNQLSYSSGNSNSISSGNNLTLGKFTSTTAFPYYGEIADVRIYNKVLSTKEIKDYHNSFVKPTLVEDFKNNPIGTNLTPYGWNKGTGVYKVSKLSADVTSGTLKLPKNTHYLECVTAGTLAIPSKQAYGTWEFSWYKGADGTQPVIALLSPNLYDFIVDSSEYLALRKTGSRLFWTTNSYISNNTWYRVKITRTTAGVFTLFIKGGAFIPTEGYNGWTLVSTSGGFGTNPVTDTTYTSSNYFVLDLDASDRIADIKLTDGIIV